MGNCILAAIIRITTVSNIGLVIFQPVGNGTFIFFHLSGNQSHISAVVHIMMPIILQSQFRLLILSINHQARSITVKSVYYMRLAVLASLMKIIIKHRFHIQSRMTGCHTQDTNVFLDNNQISVFINNLKVSAFKYLLILLCLAHTHLHTRLQGIIKLGNGFAIYLDSPTLQSLLHLGLAWSLHILHQPFQQRSRFFYLVMLIFIWVSVAISIIGMLIKISFSILLSHIVIDIIFLT